MPIFKQKNTKKIVMSKKTSTTLDGKHKEIIDSIQKEETEVLPTLLKEKKDLTNKLNDVLTIEDRLEVQDNLTDLKEQISQIKKRKKEYLLNNSNYIFEYFENKKKIAECTNKTTLLDAFFNKNKDELKESIISNEKKNIQKYLTNVDDSFLDINNFIQQTDICRDCNKGEMIPVEHEGILVCNMCSKSIPYLVENEKPSYKEPPKEVCFYAYKRINHFREILAQFQAKETTDIPESVYNDIIMEIKKERIKNMAVITPDKMRTILKKIKKNDYYEHIPYIINQLNGLPAPVIAPEIEEIIRGMFKAIQIPFEKYCPNKRKNFLSYNYVMYKFFELLELDEYLHCFQLLKSRTKLHQQDQIWKNICKDLNWQFIKSL